MSDLNPAVKRVLELKKAFEEKNDRVNFSALVIGDRKTGKTSLLKTARKPVLLDLFDPGGWLPLKKEIDAGEIIVRDFSDEISDDPKQFRRWEKSWINDLNSGFFDLFGTYCIDSLTTFLGALSNAIRKEAPIDSKDGKKRRKGSLSISDYQPLYATIEDIIKSTSSTGVDFILTAHLETDKDELTGEILTDLAAFKGLKSRLPILFSEVWVAQKKQTAKGVEYQLLTNDKGRTKAGSRLSSLNEPFSLEEPADIKHLLKKAGLPFDDKPISWNN